MFPLLLAAHMDLAIQNGPFVDHQRLGGELSLDAARRQELEPLFAVHVPLEAAGNDDEGGSDLGLDVSCFCYMHGVAGFNFAGYVPLHAEAVVQLQGAVPSRTG